MEDNKKLNIVMLPWLAFGHIIPYLELAKHLATKGHHIFFVSTPRNLQRLPKIPQNLAPLITLVPLPLPRVEGLPPNAEATSDVGFDIGTDLLKKAFDGLQEPMTKFLESSTASSSLSLDWIIYDFCCFWVPPIADKFSIRKVFFSIYFARTLTGFPTKQMEGTNTWTDLGSPPPWIPFPNSSVYFLPHEARSILRSTNQITSSGVSDVFRLQSCVQGCDLIAVRSCAELEVKYLQLLEDLDERIVFPLGLLPPSIEQGLGEDTWELINIWLVKQTKGSVLYVAFGSEFELNQDQLTELALGLELSESPFFWVFRRSGASPLELPDGFEERTRGRGMVWTSWAPQLRILSHESVGGFLTHCGWSSIIEALQFAKPLIMLPLAIDHGLYARFMSKDKRVGVEIPRNEEDGSFTRRSVAEFITLVLQDEAGKVFKDEAEKLSVIFADKSLHERYIDRFSDYLCNYKSAE